MITKSRWATKYCVGSDVRREMYSGHKHTRYAECAICHSWTLEDVIWDLMRTDEYAPTKLELAKRYRTEQDTIDQRYGLLIHTQAHEGKDGKWITSKRFYQKIPPAEIREVDVLSLPHPLEEDYIKSGPERKPKRKRSPKKRL